MLKLTTIEELVKQFEQTILEAYQINPQYIYHCPIEKLDQRMNLVLKDGHESHDLVFDNDGNLKFVDYSNGIKVEPLLKTDTAVDCANKVNVAIQKHCDHSWKVYDSGWSRYEYCGICDKKKDK